MFRVLPPSPKTEKTSEVAYTADGRPVYYHRITAWPAIGTAKDYAEAREKFGGRPVLEEIKN
jgi:hypothetical protein